MKKTDRDGKPGYAVELTPAGEAMAMKFYLFLGLNAKKDLV